MTYFNLRCNCINKSRNLQNQELTANHRNKDIKNNQWSDFTRSDTQQYNDVVSILEVETALQGSCGQNVRRQNCKVGKGRQSINKTTEPPTKEMVREHIRVTGEAVSRKSTPSLCETAAQLSDLFYIRIYLSIIISLLQIEPTASPIMFRII